MVTTLIDKVASLLSREFPASSPQLEPVRDNGRLWGVLVWDQFEGIDQINRQERLWSVLREHLSPDELHGVSAILTMTPNEIGDD